MLKSDKLSVFHEMEQLDRAVAQAGFSLDFRSIARLNTSFLEASEEYPVLNLKEYSEEPDNIVFMPELQVPWAYPAVILGQIVVTVTSVVLFRRIKWL